MVRLNQVVALVKGKKSEAQAAQTKAYQLYQKPDHFAGLTKTYEPKDEEGDRYPGEEKRLQLRTEEVLQNTFNSLNALFDIVEMQDSANCIMRGSVIVDGQTLLKDVPPTHLMFLEHKLTDIITLLSSVPVLDPTKEWTYSEEGRCFRSAPVKRTKTKKIARYNEMKAETDLHPALMDKEYEDVVEGLWSTTEFSGAITEERKHQLVERARKLKGAIIVAREEANSNKVDVVPGCGKIIINYILSNK